MRAKTRNEPSSGAQHVFEQPEFAVLLDLVHIEIDAIGRLGDGADFNAHGIAHVIRDQVLHRAFDGGGEEQGLPVAGDRFHDALHRGEKTHVQHAVGFVQNQHAHRTEIDEAAAEKIVKPAGSRDQHPRALADGLQLRALADAANDYGGARAGAGCHRHEHFVDLHGQLARGREDDGAHAGAARLLFEQVKEGQDKRQGFAGAGLRGGNQVFAGQRRLNRLRLNGSGLNKSVLGEIALQESGKGEL